MSRCCPECGGPPLIEGGNPFHEKGCGTHRLTVERDALKSECIRMMDEIASLRRQAEDVQRYRDALTRAHEELDALRLGGMCNKTLDCGGTCYLHKGHKSPCLCSGDMDGPGSCPA